VTKEPHDFGAITSVLVKWARWGVHLTPAALWSAIVTLAVAIGYVVNAQHDIRNAQRDIRQLHDTVGDLQRQSDLLHKIDTQLAVMGAKVDDIANEVDRQREWREKIEDVAELPPHARRRTSK
jgi:hypothetical protein